jgi:outer membrane protein assembly factor BamE (lipoprotein component of BamABCDE complex)
LTTKDEIFNTMGSPSIQINDIDNVWIYLVSLKEKKVFEEDALLFQNIFRFVFNKNGVLKDVSALTADNFQQITFSSDKTKVRRDAYSITDQLYDAFTRGQ